MDNESLRNNVGLFYLVNKVLALLNTILGQYTNAASYLKQAIDCLAYFDNRMPIITFHTTQIDFDKRLLCCFAGIIFENENQLKDAADYYKKALHTIPDNKQSYALFNQINWDLHYALQNKLNKIQNKIIKREHIRAIIKKSFNKKSLSIIELLITRGGTDSPLISNKDNLNTSKTDICATTNKSQIQTSMSTI